MRLLPLTLLTFALVACTSPAPIQDASVVDIADAPRSDIAQTDVLADVCHPSAVTYPPPPYGFVTQSVVPNLEFTNELGVVDLSQYFTPCIAQPRLLMVRVMAAWSGPAQWQASHTALVRSALATSRLTIVDLLVLGPNNVPAVREDLAPWRVRYDDLPDALAIDPSYAFKAAFPAGGQSPLIELIDPRTMSVINVLMAPNIDDLRFSLNDALAILDGTTRPSGPTRDLFDGRFAADQLDMIHAMTPLGSPPPDPTNAVADNPMAQHLGAALFNDTRLSPSNTVSCATCHAPSNHFMDGRPTAIGIATGPRNTPSITVASYSRWQFWDGRADSLWSQALGPSENPIEMGSSRLFIAHVIADHYSAEYNAIFGALPDLSDLSRFPPAGAPNQPVFDAMSAADQETVTRVFVNMGKSIEAYERTLRPAPTPLDNYAAGDINAMSVTARDGLLAFFQSGCIQCHYGPRWTDDSFHNIGMPTGRADHQPDLGRIDAITQLLGSPFRADGPFSDAPTAPNQLSRLFPDETMLGQFRTSTLREVSLTGPWGHGGTFATLQDVMRHYATRATEPAAPTSAGHEDIHLIGFHSEDAALQPLVELMQAMGTP